MRKCTNLCEQRPLEDDLGSSFAEHSEPGIVVQLNNGAHRFSHRVERIDFVQLFLGHLDPVILIVETEFVDKPEQRTLRLVADLLR